MNFQNTNEEGILVTISDIYLSETPIDTLKADANSATQTKTHLGIFFRRPVEHIHMLKIFGEVDKINIWRELKIKRKLFGLILIPY